MRILTDMTNALSANAARLCACAFVLAALGLSGAVTGAQAQNSAPDNAPDNASANTASADAGQENTASGDEMDAAVAEILGEPLVGGDEFPSLFFTAEERRVIEAALDKGKVLDLTDVAGVLNDEECLTCALDEPGQAEEEGPKVPTGPREIELAGVLYFSAYDWTIWLNGERVTPYFIPEEVIKLDVSRNNVYIEWFDEFYDRILRINLKPHQTFFMDANVILPNQPSP